MEALTGAELNGWACPPPHSKTDHRIRSVDSVEQHPFCGYQKFFNIGAEPIREEQVRTLNFNQMPKAGEALQQACLEAQAWGLKSQRRPR